MSVVANRRESVLEIANSFPASRHALMELGVLLKNPSATIDKIVTLLRRDPSLTARLIRTANSVAYSQFEPVASVEDAVAVIGCKEIYRLMWFALLNQFSDAGLPAYGIPAGRFRDNSLFAAVLMEELAPSARENSQTCYTVGLLRSIGKVALSRLPIDSNPAEAAEKIEEVGLAEWERTLYGMTSNEAAAVILAEWRFPPEMVEAIEHHYEPRDGAALSHLLHLACRMAELLGHGLPGEWAYWLDSDDAFKNAGLDPRNANMVIDHALDSFKRIIKTEF